MPTTSTLLSNVVDVYCFPLQDHAASDCERFATYLDQDELARVERFATDELRQRFIVSHGLMRHLLSHYVQLPPADLVFSKNSYGKPSIVDMPAFHFNLSHSDTHAVLAVAREREVGVDMELLSREIDVVALAKRFFSPTEARELAKSDNSRQDFFQVWARKEAVIKAFGLGLLQPLDQFSVPLQSQLQSEPIRITMSSQVVTCCLSSLQIDAGHAAAVALVGEQPFDINYCQWN